MNTKQARLNALANPDDPKYEADWTRTDEADREAIRWALARIASLEGEVETLRDEKLRLLREMVSRSRIVSDAMDVLKRYGGTLQ